VVEKVRTNVKVDLVRGDAFRVAFTSDSPKKAMDVAGRLASLFVNESLQDREVLATATSDFLQSQLDDARRRLVEAEGRVADFQRKHAGALPSEQDTNLTVLHNLELQVQALLDSMNREKDRRLFLERTLADLESEAQRVPAASASGMAGVAAGTLPGRTPADQLDAARGALKSLELRLKPEHPDVVYLKRVIRDLEAKVEADAAAARASDPNARSAPALAARAQTPEEAAVQRRLLETRQELSSVEIQLASKAAEERRLRDQIAIYQNRVTSTPGLAAEFTALTRDYETLRRGYETLLAKNEDAKAAAALERRQIGEQFKVIDPARLPESPISPNRFIINLIGAFAGLGIGLGLAALLEYRDNALRTEDDISTVLSIPVLAVIPVIETKADIARRKRRRLLTLAGTAAAIVLVAGSALLVWAIGSRRLTEWLR
jgi:polysaccharide chain length determinant protein (PEP-CTERM system associated)